MESTDVNRTIQSGYSEFMGLYPPNVNVTKANLLSEDMSESIKNATLTPFNVRDADSINDELGVAALPNNFTAVPIYTFLNPDLNDDASTNGCPYINEVGDLRE